MVFPSARQQRHGNQNAELRFVGEQADQHAGEPGPAIEQMQRAASNAAVRNPFWPWPILTNTAGKASATRRFRGAAGSHASRQIGRETGTSQIERPMHRDGGDQKGDQKENGGYASRRTALAAAEHGFFGGMLARRLVGLRGGPARSACRRIDVGEVGAMGLLLRSIRPSDAAIQPTTARVQMASRSGYSRASARRSASRRSQPCQICVILPQNFMNVARP